MTHSEKPPQEKAAKKSDTGEQEMLIDPPDSIHEKEAENVAMKVVHGDQLMGGGNGIAKDQVMGSGNKNDGMISRKGAVMGEQGMVASNHVREGINSTKGGGDSLPGNMKQQMKSAVGGELEDVRIHTDSKAAEMSKAVNANAFTVENDIYFGQGKFDTYSPEGKQLLAHELVHTKQKNNFISRSVTSAWGTFEADPYEAETKQVALNEKGPPVVENKMHGAKIQLWFNPGDNVKATKIGMVQAAKGMIDNKADDELDQTSKDHSISKTDAVVLPASQSFKFNDAQKVDDSGFHIDQNPKSNNPLYAGKNLKPDEKLADSKRGKGYGEFGYNDSIKGKKRPSFVTSLNFQISGSIIRNPKVKKNIQEPKAGNYLKRQRLL